MAVSRCICRAVTFAELIELHRRTGEGVEGLARMTGCGTGCGLCVPYVRLALATGRTDLPVMSAAQLEHEEKQARRKAGLS